MTSALIIGGGIAGLTAAAHLSPHMEVCLLEGESQFGYHASGRSAAMFLENYGNDVVRALNSASRAGLEAAGVLTARAFLLLADAQNAEALPTEAASFGAREIPVSEAQAMLPILDPNTVMRGPDGGRLMIWTSTADGASAPSGAGCRCHAFDKPGCAAHRAHTDGWRVQTGAGAAYEADILVNAAGAWADPVAEMAGLAPLGIQPYRRSMARLPAPGGHDTTNWPLSMGAKAGTPSRMRGRGLSRPQRKTWCRPRCLGRRHGDRRRS